MRFNEPANTVISTDSKGGQVVAGCVPGVGDDRCGLWEGWDGRKQACPRGALPRRSRRTTTPSFLPALLSSLPGVIEYWSAESYRQPEEEVQFRFKLDTGEADFWNLGFCGFVFLQGFGVQVQAGHG